MPACCGECLRYRFQAQSPHYLCIRARAFQTGGAGSLVALVPVLRGWLGVRGGGRWASELCSVHAPPSPLTVDPTAHIFGSGAPHPLWLVLYVRCKDDGRLQTDSDRSDSLSTEQVSVFWNIPCSVLPAGTHVRKGVHTHVHVYVGSRHSLVELYSFLRGKGSAHRPNRAGASG